MPFGSEGPPPSGAHARQLARRLVERWEGEDAAELRPVFLVALPERDAAAGYLVIGSVPDLALAASYASSLGCTHALVGAYRAAGGARSLEVSLADVASKAAVATVALAAPPGELHRLEPALDSWLAGALGIASRHDGAALPAANEAAYAAVLEAMDDEVNATLLR
ncbi:MAG: hypothetical protein ACRDF0_07640, partial [Candidatus Limnocylindria bacterium]